MSIFEFTAVLLSIVLGLAIAELMSGVLRLIRAAPPWRTWWVTGAWAVWVLLTLVQTWWGSWGYQSYDLASWTLWPLLVLLAPALLLFVVAGLVFPPEPWDLDPWEYYMKVRSYFFGALVLLLVAWTIEWTWLAGQPLFGGPNIRRGLSAFLFVILAVNGRRRVHQWGVLAHWVFVVLILANLFGGDPADLGF